MKIPNIEVNVGDVPLRPARAEEFVLAPTSNVRDLILSSSRTVVGAVVAFL